MADKHEEPDREFDELYERYGRPLEAEHWGEFLAVTKDGRFVVGPDDIEVSRRAFKDFDGAYLHVYKVGEIAVGHIRSPRQVRERS